MKTIFWRFAVALLFIGTLDGSLAAVPSFSGAEGWGAITPGGRGGQVIHVTNLNDSGPGSFREALQASGPRVVVFDVAGQINLESELVVTNPFLTVAGQTAPGGGITVAGETVSMDTHDVIVRYMRFRRGTTDREDDSFGPDRTPGNMIIDHVSASWGYDENISIYRYKNDVGNVVPTHNVTIQWSISSEGLNEPSEDHPFGHAFGSTLGGKGANFHHNLWASNTGRNPSLSFSHFLDFRNNVHFNWQHRSMDGAGPEAHVNVINNYYKPGPATGKANNASQTVNHALKVRIVEPEIRDGVYPGGVGEWYVDGNVVEGYPEVTADNWEGESEVAPGQFARGVQFEQPFPVAWARVTTPHSDLSNPGPYPFPPDSRDPYDAVIPALPTIATQSAADAYQAVLAGAGASLFRDAVDERVIASVIDGNPTVGPDGDGIVHTIDDVGGYPAIPFDERGADYDTDEDGMPSDWELRHGLNPADPADRNGDFDSDGFTNLDDYLNEVGAFPAVQPIIWDGEANNRYAQIENWDIAFQPSRFDTAVIDNATVVVDAVGQDAGTLHIGQNATSGQTELSIQDGWLRVANAVQLGSESAVPATLSLSGGALFTPLLDKTDTAEFIFTGGELHAGVVTFDLVNQGGTIAPGDSPGLTHVMGDLELQGGTLEIEIGGTEVNQYDRVVVDGTATLGGVLKVELIDLGEGAYVPQLGDQFPFMSVQGGAGETFDDFDLPELDAGLKWELNPGGVTLFLEVVPALTGDYNFDGVVNAADYAVWRESLGQEGQGLPADGDGDGMVDQDDYDQWKENFGATLDAGSGAASEGVPEPGAATKLLLCLVAASLVAHRSAFVGQHSQYL